MTVPREMFEAQNSITPSLDYDHNYDTNLLSYFNHSINPKLENLLDTKSSMRVIHTNCSLPQKSDNCSFVQFEALLDIADRTVCKCEEPRISVGNKCRRKSAESAQPSTTAGGGGGTSGGVSVFAVTPTYTRHTQKVDLTSLCYIIQQVPNLIWIVIEDSTTKTTLVANLLQRCKVIPILYTYSPSHQPNACTYIHTCIHT